MKREMTVVNNMHFKGGPNDNFISGLWIGDAVQENVLFTNCRFNGVEAQFKHCIFIDCQNAPEGEGCINISLPFTQRLRAEWRNDNGDWIGN